MTSREAVLAAIQPFRARLRGLRARSLPPGLRSLALFFVLLGVPGLAKDTGVLSDPRDGHTYRTVAIGRQTWMAENLNHETPDSWCYDDDPAHCAAYGRLYTREAARTACPAGWHLPSEAEWFALERHLGMNDEESTPDGKYAMRRAVFADKSGIDRDAATRTNAFSVRCIED